MFNRKQIEKNRKECARLRTYNGILKKELLGEIADLKVQNAIMSAQIKDLFAHIKALEEYLEIEHAEIISGVKYKISNK